MVSRNDYNIPGNYSARGWFSTSLSSYHSGDRPTSGQILVGQQDLNTMDENALVIYRRRMLGFIFQQFNLVASMTALENVAFPMRFTRTANAVRLKRARSLLQQVDLGQFVYWTNIGSLPGAARRDPRPGAGTEV